ncbi:MAG: hypothetical protein V3T30_02200, partial [Thermodesulfobacteriota bacterium]
FPKDGDALPITYFLTRIVNRYPNLKKFEISTAYPNYGVFNEDSKKCVLFTHGHYIEPLYMMMSKLRTLVFPDTDMPDTVQKIEEQNFAWIDFFWSSMGRSGAVGEDVELIYDKLQDPEELKKLLKNLPHGIAVNYGREGWFADKVEETTLALVFNGLVNAFDGTERGKPSELLSKDARAGLWKYVQGPLYKELTHELSTKPQEMSIVFGHTHKPFSRDETFQNYSHWVNVYNSGGWVVDTPDTKPIHGGAVILIDEELNAASLRMYNEAELFGDYQVKVECAIYGSEEPNDLTKTVAAMIKNDQDPWRAFSTATARAVDVRHKNLYAKIHSKV